MNIFYQWIEKKQIQKSSLDFFEQLFQLHQMGFSIIQSLTLMKITKHSKMPHWILHKIYAQIEQGFNLSQSIATVKDYFCPMTITFVQVAEQSGDFFKLMNTWVQHEKKRKEMMQRIYTQCSYPLFLCIIWGLFILFFAQTTLPEYQALAEQLGGPTHVHHREWTLILIPLFFIFLFRKPMIQRWSFKQNLDWWIWSTCMHMGREMGISDIQSLEIIEHHFKNLHQIDWIQYTIRQIRMGTTLEDCFKNIPPIIQQYLPFFHHQEVFEKLSQYFHQCLQKQLQGIERYLQPILLFFIAILAGSTLWMIYQPLLEMGTRI
ncbi:MAG: protein transport protein HofC [Pseudomonadota bacterium]|nr:protein transport protein HofC [Pseudomonadota bacterium]